MEELLAVMKLMKDENERLSFELKCYIKENKELLERIKKLEGELFMNQYYLEENKPQWSDD